LHARLQTTDRLDGALRHLIVGLPTKPLPNTTLCTAF
jgi:hypothetical protein